MAGSSSTSGSEHPSESGSDAVVLHENFAQNLAEFVAVENLPLDLGSGPPFEHLCRSLNPAAERVPTATLTRTVKSSYRESKKALIEQLACVKTQVSISVEIWRDYWQVHSYISVTCHWIDDSWSIQRRLLGFRLLQGAHTAENICRTVLSVLAEYDLLGKIFSILFECVGSNVASIEDLKPTFESLVGCRAFPFVDVCRVLSLCARDGLQQVELQLGPIRQAIGYLWSNPQVMNQWSKFCKTNNTKSEKFSREIPTRWDSTYLLLQQFLKHKELLRRFFALNVKGTLLFPNQWAVCEKVCVLLEKFYEGIQLISNDHYSNPSSLLTFVGYISWNLNKYYKDEDLKHCVEAMRSRLGKHGLNLPVINLVANVLDPRIRLGNLKHRLTMYYDNLIPVKDEHSPDPGIIESNVRQHLNDFYLEYKSKYGGENFAEPKTKYARYSSSDTFKPLKCRFMKEIMEESRRQRQAYLEHELENYLKTGVPIENMNMLQWWSESEYNFPVISRMAKEVLACPASTVALEQVFYAGDNILSERQSAMCPDSLEAQLCLGDWIKAQKRNHKEG